MHPGEYVLADEAITINEGKQVLELSVTNRGDRPIQIGSHYHFAEANPALECDRSAALGHHLDIPAGTAVRFEPGDTTQVRLVPYGGKRRVHGFHNLVNGHLDPYNPARVEHLSRDGYNFAHHGSNTNEPNSVDKEA